MAFRSNKIYFSKFVNFYWNFPTKVYISGPLGVSSVKLFFYFDITKFKAEKRCFKASSLKHLFSALNFVISSITFGYYTFINLVGLGYKLKKVTNTIYRLYLGQSHYVFIHAPLDVFIWAFQNKLTLFSIYPDKLFSLSSNIMLLRKLNAYKLRGLIRPGQIIILKEGKQR